MGPGQCLAWRIDAAGSNDRVQQQHAQGGAPPSLYCRMIIVGTHKDSFKAEYVKIEFTNVQASSLAPLPNTPLQHLPRLFPPFNATFYTNVRAQATHTHPLGVSTRREESKASFLASAATTA